MLKHWQAIPIQGNYDYDAQALKELWSRLHAGELEPFPSADYLRSQLHDNLTARQSIEGFTGDYFTGDYDELSVQLLAAWRLFHRGDFQQAYEAGRRLGYPGYLIAHMSTCAYAENVALEPDAMKQLLWTSAQDSLAAANAMPDHVNSLFYYGLHLGRYSESISLIKAAAENIAPKFQNALNETLRRAPDHVLANVGIGMFHASVVNAVGSLVAKMTFGASRDKAQQHFEHALNVAPHLPVSYIEYAKGLSLLDAKKHRGQIERLYHKATQLTVMDAMEELDLRRCTN